MLVRYLKASELPTLAEKAVRFTEASPSVKIVPELFEAYWQGLYSAGVGLIFVTDDLTGALGAMTMADPNDGELTAIEIFWFVEPESRGRGMDLMKAFEDWAKMIGCKRITIAHMMDSFPERLNKIYRRKGYLPLEIHYRKEL